MWTYYRKTFYYMQAFILILLVLMHFIFKVPPMALLVYLAVMELFSMIGAAWSMRLRRKVQSARGELPDNR